MLILCVFFSISAFAYDVEVDGIYYNLIKKGKSAEVTRGNNSYDKDEINIPEAITVDNEVYNVTAIGEDSFRGAYSKSITIPNSVTSIGDGAFGNCTSLTSITIPNSVTSIGEGAFAGCTSLTTITIPNSVTIIGYYTFAGCTSITSITIHSSVTSIG